MPELDLIKDAVEKAFDPTKPNYYANIFYISGTVLDLRIAFGTMRPINHESTDQMVDRFDASVTLPHSVAKDLAEKILTILEAAKT
jgi:hypothetical protein